MSSGEMIGQIATAVVRAVMLAALAGSGAAVAALVLYTPAGPATVEATPIPPVAGEVGVCLDPVGRAQVTCRPGQDPEYWFRGSINWGPGAAPVDGEIALCVDDHGRPRVCDSGQPPSYWCRQR